MGSFAFLQALGTLDSCSPSIHSGPSALSSLPLCCWVSPQTMALSRWPLPQATLPTKGSPHPSPTHTCSRSSQGPGLFPCFCLTFFPLLHLYLSNFVASSKLAFKIYPRSEHCFHLHCSHSGSSHGQPNLSPGLSNRLLPFAFVPPTRMKLLTFNPETGHFSARIPAQRHPLTFSALRSARYAWVTQELCCPSGTPRQPHLRAFLLPFSVTRTFFSQPHGHVACCLTSFRAPLTFYLIKASCPDQPI